MIVVRHNKNDFSNVHTHLYNVADNIFHMKNSDRITYTQTLYT